ncbi:MAG: hypothetical protein IOD12_16670 [Silvanigrellales bacterium]|nr:hypothetical protein [Silvanigrellales bacterium]
MVTLKPMMTVVIAAFLATSTVGCKSRQYNNSAARSERPREGQCGTPGAPDNPNPAHCEGAVYLDGEYTFVDGLDSMRKDGDRIYWAGSHGLPFVSKLFGTTTLYSPDQKPMPSVRTGKPHLIRDLQYLVGPNKVGLRLIPVTVGTEAEATNFSDGYAKPVKGSNILDAKIREQQGLPAGAPIFAAAVYLYPGSQFVELNDLASQKTQGSVGHMSVYIGDGVSKHSPKGLHKERWTVAGGGEPSTIVSLSLEGADQAELNKNFIAWTWILNAMNGGPSFPGDYSFDPVRVSNLQAHAEFARKWIEGDLAELKKDQSWGTYCAESSNMIITLGMNVPLTEEYFVKVWAQGNSKQAGGSSKKGEQYAKDLFLKLKKRYLTEIVNRTTGKIPTAEEIAAFKFIDKPFKPLWEQLGVSPLSSKTSEGFPYALDTTTDLAAAFVENFASWADVGPAVSAMAVAGFADTFEKRIGTDASQYMSAAMPIIAAGFVAHASTIGIKSDAQLTEYLNLQFATPGFPNALISPLKNLLMQNPAAMKRDVALSVEQAWSEYRAAVRPVLMQSSAWAPKLSIKQQKDLRKKNAEDLLRMAEVVLASGDRELATQMQRLAAENKSPSHFVRFNSPPSLLFRVANGLKKPSDKVKVSIVGTIFGAEMLREKRQGEQDQWELDELRRLLPENLGSTQQKKWDVEMLQGGAAG